MHLGRWIGRRPRRPAVLTTRTSPTPLQGRTGGPRSRPRPSSPGPWLCVRCFFACTARPSRPFPCRLCCSLEQPAVAPPAPHHAHSTMYLHTWTIGVIVSMYCMYEWMCAMAGGGRPCPPDSLSCPTQPLPPPVSQPLFRGGPPLFRAAPTLHQRPAGSKWTVAACVGVQSKSCNPPSTSCQPVSREGCGCWSSHFPSPCCTR